MRSVIDIEMGDRRVIEEGVQQESERKSNRQRDLRVNEKSKKSKEVKRMSLRA